MSRFTCRRPIVLFALLCQVLTAGFSHVPSAHAMPTTKPLSAAEPRHCHDDAQAEAEHAAGASEAHAHSVRMPSDSGMPGAGHHCKPGSCACAHGFAVMPTLAPRDGAGVTHPPLPSIYRVPAAIERLTPLFRPPI